MLVSVRSVTKRAMRNRRTMVKVVVGDGCGRMQVVFFNQPWREQQLREGLQVALFGKAEVYRGGLQMTNPVVDLDRRPHRPHRAGLPAEREGRADRRGRSPAGSRTRLRKSRAAGHRRPVPEPCASTLRADRRRRRAFRSIHLAETIAEKEQARRRLAFDELLRVQIDARHAQARARARVAGDPARRRWRPLTERLHARVAVRAHRRAATGDRRDRARPRRAASDAPAAAGRRRLRQDGGRGRARCSTAVQGGHQGALMAPTEVLAEQHADECATDARGRDRARSAATCSATGRCASSC